MHTQPLRLNRRIQIFFIETASEICNSVKCLPSLAIYRSLNCKILCMILFACLQFNAVDIAHGIEVNSQAPGGICRCALHIGR